MTDEGALPTRQDDTGDEPKPTPEEVIQKLPPEVQEVVQAAMVSWQGPMPNPITSKLTPGHITQLLELESKTIDAQAFDRRDARHWATIAGLLLVGIVGILIVVLVWSGESALIEQLLPLAAVFIGGSGLGYGFRAWRD